MSQDLQQLTPFDGLNEPVEYNAAPAEPEKPKIGMLTKAHRALRGRYWIAIPLGMILGSVCAVAGFKSQTPVFKSEGLLRIKSRIDSIMMVTPNSDIPMYEEFMLAQVQKITSRTLVDRAIKDSVWSKAMISSGRWPAPKPGEEDKFPPIDLAWDAVQKFAVNLTAEHPPRTQVIHVAFLDRDPQVAAAGVKAMLKAYETMYNNQYDVDIASALKRLNDHIDELNRNIQMNRTHIQALAQESGTGSADFGKFYEAKVLEVNALESRLNDAKLSLELAKKQLTPEEYYNGLTDNQIAMLDGQMANLVVKRQNLELDIAQLKQMGENYPQYKAKLPLLATLNAQIEAYGKDFRNLHIASAANGNSGSQLKDVRVLQDQVEAISQSLTKAHDEMKSIGEKQMQVEKLKTEIVEWEKDRTDFEKQVTLYVLEHGGSGRLDIISLGDPPIVPFKDNRKKMGAAGGLLGGLAPLGLCLLFGLMDRRWRFSDQAESTTPGSPPLLGILPMLPDRLTDPEQAAIAAHCIHQIRIMLQVAAQQDQKRIFMITSASTADGKTSLTMALGLSFAASGARTLVIDCDMVGQGLTHRLKARQSGGLLEALASGTLQGRVKKTTTPNLYILPIGGADSAHAGTISPSSIKRLLVEARKIFDTVLIDTGPIMGSLEASVVAAAADSVILTVARNQNQLLVERSIRQLRAVKADIAGLVFNRAERRDFSRSVGSTSLRSVSAMPQPQRLLIPEGEEPSRFGPLARAVASFTPGGSHGSARALEHLPAKGEGNGSANGSAHKGRGTAAALPPLSTDSDESPAQVVAAAGDDANDSND